jgi:hypothetical protein
MKRIDAILVMLAQHAIKNIAKQLHDEDRGEYGFGEKGRARRREQYLWIQTLARLTAPLDETGAFVAGAKEVIKSLKHKVD